MEEKDAEQQNLFGEQDFVYNTIHVQLTDTRAAVKDCTKTIERKEKERKMLREVEAALVKSAAIVKKRRDALKKEEEKDGKK